MATVFVKDGNTYTPFNEANLDTHKEIPVGVYLVREKPMGGPMYFELTDNFAMPTKMYGDTEVRAERILTTFHSRTASTGVLLSGEKGSGKTLLAKMVAIRSGLPVILINAPWHGDKFNTFMQALAQPAVVLFDEFEKVYTNGNDEQEGTQAAILTLLDGVFASKKLFVLTCNDKYRVNEHMKNRPGRLFYALEFKGLSLEFIEQYCQDRLIDKEQVNAVCSLSMLFRDFNFDMLQALVEEMNRYNEDPTEASKMLNMKVDTWTSFGQYQVLLSKNGEPVPVLVPTGGVYDTNPVFLNRFDMVVNPVLLKKKNPPVIETDEDGDETYESRQARDASKDIRIFFHNKDLKHVDKEAGSYTFINQEGYTAVVTHKPVQSFHAF